MKLLALDLSTNATGWAVFEDGKLTSWGLIKPKVKGITKMKYPLAQLMKCRDMSDKVVQLMLETKADEVVIEEVNRGINRIAQKSLDALHFMILDRVYELVGDVEGVSYMDSNGKAKSGWRPILGIRLSDADKKENARIRRQNKKDPTQKTDVINWKTLSVRHVNKKYSLGLSPENNPKTDGDIADAICLGEAFLKAR